MSHAGRVPRVPAAPQRRIERRTPPPLPAGWWGGPAPRPRGSPEPGLGLQAPAGFRHVCEKPPCVPGEGAPGLLSHWGTVGGSQAREGKLSQAILEEFWEEGCCLEQDGGQEERVLRRMLDLGRPSGPGLLTWGVVGTEARTRGLGLRKVGNKRHPKSQ